MSITIIDPIYGNVLFGDTDGVLANHDVGGAQVLTGGPNYVVGDARDMQGAAIGGKDNLWVVSDEFNGAAVAVGDSLNLGETAQGGNDYMIVIAAAADPDRGDFPAFGDVGFGDALTMNGHAHGGRDVIILDASGASASVYGDAYSMTDDAVGGNDGLGSSTTLRTGSDSLYGDAYSMTGRAKGGNDSLSSNASSAELWGDAGVMADNTVGGNDVLYGGRGSSTLIGDADSMTGAAKGGNDRLIGGASDNSDSSFLFGDAFSLGTGTKGGDDVLTSGSTSDVMWGDAAQVAIGTVTGRDAFVFGANNGQDVVKDFRHGEDRIVIDVSTGIRTFDQLLPHLQVASGGTLIAFGGLDQVRVEGVAKLTASDFVFGHGDTITGGAGGDSLSSLGGDNTYFGGAGSDSFVLKAKALANSTGLGAGNSGADVAIQDFEGAGGWSATGNDFIAFTGFGAGSTLTFDHFGQTGPSTDPTLQFYTLHDTTSGNDYSVFIHSLDGAKIALGDFAFY